MEGPINAPTQFSDTDQRRGCSFDLGFKTLIAVLGSYMRISELLKLDEAERHVALEQNELRLHRRILRRDAAVYLEDMLMELHQVACKAGLRGIARSINKTREELRSL